MPTNGRTRPAEQAGLWVKPRSQLGAGDAVAARLPISDRAHDGLPIRHAHHSRARGLGRAIRDGWATFATRIGSAARSTRAGSRSPGRRWILSTRITRADERPERRRTIAPPSSGPPSPVRPPHPGAHARMTAATESLPWPSRDNTHYGRIRPRATPGTLPSPPRLPVIAHFQQQVARERLHDRFLRRPPSASPPAPQAHPRIPCGRNGHDIRAP